MFAQLTEKYVVEPGERMRLFLSELRQAWRDPIAASDLPRLHDYPIRQPG